MDEPERDALGGMAAGRGAWAGAREGLREQRRFVRIEGRFAAAYEVVATDTGQRSPARRGIVDNLSMGGARLVTEHPLQPGLLVTMRFPITTPEGPDLVLVDGRVVRCYPDPRPGECACGIEFTDISLEEAKRLAYLLENMARQPAPMEKSVAALFDSLRSFAHRAATLGDPQALLDELVQAAAEVTAAPGGCVLLLDRTGEYLHFAAARGASLDALSRFRVAVGQGIAGLVALHAKPMNIARPYDDPRWFAEVAESVGVETDSLLAVPIMFRERVIGVLEVLNKPDADRFSPTDILALDLLATHAAVALQCLRMELAPITALHHVDRGTEQAERRTSDSQTDDAGGRPKALAVCVHGAGTPLFTTEARSLLEQLDPTGVLAYEVQNLLTFAVDPSRRESMDGAEREIDAPDGRCLFIRFAALEGDGEEPAGLVAYLGAAARP
ncbi:MAG TPA: GAF domain-containing protein [Armatimonadota bacterium]|nr:GAF domain-containing protein [Armatimonadota bacterium]